MFLTVEQLLESVSETLSEALLTDYTDKHEVDLESSKEFNLDKMEDQRRQAEEDRLMEKIKELESAAAIDDMVDLSSEDGSAVQEGKFDGENSDSSVNDLIKMEDEEKEEEA
jgi:hypothetical protein